MDQPRRPPDHPDYQLECEEALEAAMIGMIDSALAAGWDKATIWPALRSLVDNLEAGDQALAETQAEIARARRQQ